MIYEIRTYQLKPGSVGEVEKRFGEAYEYRKKYSELAAFWHSEIGPLNEIIHVWGYESLAERDKVRAEAAKDANWPPKIQEFIMHMSAEILQPFDFVQPIKPGKMGPIFEMRSYGLKDTDRVLVVLGPSSGTRSSAMYASLRHAHEQTSTRRPSSHSVSLTSE